MIPPLEGDAKEWRENIELAAIVETPNNADL
jgi:hypothetical protein